MSKFFFKGRVDARQDYRSYGNKTKPEANPGSEHNPIELWVANAAREQEIKALLDQHEVFAVVHVDATKEENIQQLDAVLATPKTVVLEKTPNRNDPCLCGSGKKYKKCCG